MRRFGGVHGRFSRRSPAAPTRTRAALPMPRSLPSLPPQQQALTVAHIFSQRWQVRVCVCVCVCGTFTVCVCSLRESTVEAWGLVLFVELAASRLGSH